MARQGPHAAGASGRSGSKENHPGLRRNSIRRARHRAAPDGEWALQEPLRCPVGGFGLVTDNTGNLYSHLSVYYPKLKKIIIMKRGIFSVWLRTAALLQDGNPTSPFQSRLQAEETLCLVLL